MEAFGERQIDVSRNRPFRMTHALGLADASRAVGDWRKLDQLSAEVKEDDRIGASAFEEISQSFLIPRVTIGVADTEVKYIRRRAIAMQGLHHPVTATGVGRAFQQTPSYFALQRLQITVSAGLDRRSERQQRKKSYGASHDRAPAEIGIAFDAPEGPHCGPADREQAL